MRKLITLLLSLGFINTAFAQNADEARAYIHNKSAVDLVVNYQVCTDINTGPAATCVAAPAVTLPAHSDRMMIKLGSYQFIHVVDVVSVDGKNPTTYGEYACSSASYTLNSDPYLGTLSFSVPIEAGAKQQGSTIACTFSIVNN